MDQSETPLNPIFDKLQKKFAAVKLKEDAELKKQLDKEMSDRFDVQMRNFEPNLYNSNLYNQVFPMKEILLEGKYEVQEGLEEYVYTEYFKNKYPYSNVTVDVLQGKRKCVRVVLMDTDRDIFLGKHGIKVEEKQIPEFYFIKL